MGSWLVDELVKRGHEVISTDNLLGGKRSNVNRDCKFVRADLRQRNRIRPIIKGVHVVFHLAAYAAEGQSLFSPISINDVNITPMNNLLVECVNNNVQRVVFTSSMAVYGSQTPPFSEELDRRPVDPYGAAKAYCETMLEIFAKNFGLEFVIIRPHNIYGPRQNISDPYRNVLGIWINRRLRGKPPLIYGDGEQKRAFSYVDDITPPLAESGFSNKVKNEIVNLGSDEVVTINEACRIFLDKLGSDFKPEYLPPRPGEVKNAYCTIEKSVKLLGYETKHPLRVGLEKMTAWAKSKGPIKLTYTLPLEITKNAPRTWIEKSV